LSAASCWSTGYDISRQRSKSIVDLPDIEFDFVATMGCGDACPFVRAKHREDWDIPDPKPLPRKNFAPFAILLGAKSKLCSRRYESAF
jgi:arsenate reductase (thioredoxin)